MPIEQIEAIGRAPLAALDALARAVWQDFGVGKLTEAEAGTITEAIEARRRALRRPVQAHSPLKLVIVREDIKRAPATNVASPAASPSGATRYRDRGPHQLVLRIPRPVTYDRARSRERRRRLAYSGPLPAQLAAAFSPAEVAVLRIIADEHRDRGGCARSIDEIAARAGVCRRTVQNALRHAERLGLVTITERRRAGNRNLSNIVRVISRAWIAWIEHARKAHHRDGGGCKTVHATHTLEFSRGLKGNTERATNGAARRCHDRGPDRAHCRDAL